MNVFQPVTAWNDPASQFRYPDYQMLVSVEASIERELAGMDLYYRLAEAAPTEIEKHNLQQAAENKKIIFQQMNHLYFSLTGQFPAYAVQPINYESYEEGLIRACAADEESLQAYEQHRGLLPYPNIQQLFGQAALCDEQNITWLRAIHDEADEDQAAAQTIYAEHSGYATLESLANMETEGNDARITDHGSQPFVVNIENAAEHNRNYRTAIWTGKHLQVTLMSIAPGSDIGLEMHPNTDQFLRIEEGDGLVQMGSSKNNLTFQVHAKEDDAIMVPAGTWHNLTNTGHKPIKLYSVYAPPEHPFGTVHTTKEQAMQMEHH